MFFILRNHIYNTGEEGNEEGAFMNETTLNGQSADILSENIHKLSVLLKSSCGLSPTRSCCS